MTNETQDAYAFLAHSFLNDGISISVSAILPIPCLKQNKREFLSEKPLLISGEFYLNKSLISLYFLLAFS